MRRYAVYAWRYSIWLVNKNVNSKIQIWILQNISLYLQPKSNSNMETHMKWHTKEFLADFSDNKVKK